MKASHPLGAIPLMPSRGDIMTIKFTRQWAMPNKNSFSIAPIKELVINITHGVSIDPFSGGSRYASITNDLDPEIDADCHLDALEFLEKFDDLSVDTVLFDPPYSPRQVSECYKKLDKTVNMQTTQASFWSNMKKEISRIVKHGGVVLTCGWNSGGIGKKYGFEINEILLVPHGGWHNDTIVTLETKVTTGSSSVVEPPPVERATQVRFLAT